jgi:hypothetical protein
MGGQYQREWRHGVPPSNRIRDGADQSAMTEQDAVKIADIIADAAPLPLFDAAYTLWRWRYRLDSLEGRPTAEEIRINRTLTPEQFAVKYRHDRDHAQDGPAFNHLKRAHPRADDGAIRQAIITAVKFEDACFRYFEQGAGEYWQRCVHAVARARKDFPGFGESTYQQAANDVAYYCK